MGGSRDAGRCTGAGAGVDGGGMGSSGKRHVKRRPSPLTPAKRPPVGSSVVSETKPGTPFSSGSMERNEKATRASGKGTRAPWVGGEQEPGSQAEPWVDPGDPSGAVGVGVTGVTVLRCQRERHPS